MHSWSSAVETSDARDVGVGMLMDVAWQTILRYETSCNRKPTMLYVNPQQHGAVAHAKERETRALGFPMLFGLRLVPAPDIPVDSVRVE